ncbi:AI-2E family transporter [Candidatus Peregrinibacteria bacterium]|jgi:putative permease|nr:AI-2E family transporter [Candidatus Peregrinibacteria bacterium]MBT3598611.1 AI-2E family transporter [Candidatus Peregrinibacteria bacterium]MBT4367026.1 AI-2E family transporter [Candidatus Peregrinibacteria bacterium]MBT4586131.1 AI-2E family transporter [Candidatus Peregrinibacteria bacterium]MBT6730606.1 AI-2E family transporter [Candidatus Peregrinibacteria bacterium]
MTSQKKPQNHFTSLRIIGKKAQNMIERAKQTSDKERKKSSSSKLPKKETLEEVLAHISVLSIVKGTFAILFIIIGAYALYQTRDKVILLLFAVFLAVVIDPGVQTLEKWGVPRGVGVIIQYLAFLFLFFFLVLSLIPIIANQLREIAVLLSVKVDTFLANPQIDLPLLSNQLNEQLTAISQTTLQNLEIDKFTDALEQLSSQLSGAASQSILYAANLAGSVLKFFVSLVIVMVLAFFIQLEKEKIINWAIGFFPDKYKMYLDNKSEAIHTKIGQWARGQMMLSLSIFSLTLIALIILDIDYALTLAVLAGFCELIPAVGPFFAAIPAVLIAATKGGMLWMLIIAAMYYVIQWCENNLLVPLIMKRAVGLSPIAILFAMLIGISFPDIIHPILGVMLAIPVTTIITIFLEDWRKHGK